MIFFNCQRDAITVGTVIFCVPFAGLLGFIKGAPFPLSFVVHPVMKAAAEHPHTRTKNTGGNLTLSHLKQLLEKASGESEWLRKCKSASLSG